MATLPDWNDLPESLRTGLCKEAAHYCEDDLEGDAALHVYNHLKHNFDEARRLERQKVALADLFEPKASVVAPPPYAPVKSEPVIFGQASIGPYSVRFDATGLVGVTEADRGGAEHPSDVSPELVVEMAREIVRLRELQEPHTFQNRVHPWMMACFGQEISDDLMERNHRFLEEALELVQACGCSRAEAHALVDYVFDREIGEVGQEIGGVMVTLAALCLAIRRDAHADAEVELRRIWGKVEAIRAKQAAKPKFSPLPAAAPIAGVLVPFVRTLDLYGASDDSQVVWNAVGDAPAVTVGALRGLVERYVPRRAA